MPGGEFSASGGFPHEWLSRHINEKDMFALLEGLTECGRGHPGQLRRAQLVMDVGSRSVVDAFKKGRSKNPTTHGLLVRPPRDIGSPGLLALSEMGTNSGEPIGGRNH